MMMMTFLGDLLIIENNELEFNVVVKAGNKKNHIYCSLQYIYIYIYIYIFKEKTKDRLF